MVVNINGKTLQTGRFAQDHLHGTHGRLACFDILLRRTVIGALFIVRLDLPHLFLIQQHLCNTRMILDRNGQSVGNRLIHGIPVDFFTEGLIGLGDRCSGEAHKRCLRKCLTQYLRIRLRDHGAHILVRILAELNLLGMVKLRSVRFVRKTNDVCAIIDQTDFIILAVTEFLNGADIEPAAFTRTELFPQLSAIRNNADFAEVQKLFALGKQLCALFLQIFTVNDHNDCGRADFRHIRAAQRQLTSQERHRVGFAASRRTEIRAAFAAFFHDGSFDALS